MTNASDQFVVFGLDDQRYALPLAVVERVVRVVEVVPLPKALSIVPGIVNVQGRIVPVVNIRQRFRNIRQRFRLPEREIRLSDQLIIAHTSRRMVALLADGVHGVIGRSQEQVARAEQIIAGIHYIEGVAKDPDGMILICDLDVFLSLEEESALDDALAKR